MKRILVLFFCLIFQNVLIAQINEIGVFMGGSNFIGDVGKTNYVAPNKLAIGILYKWNKSPRHSYRISYIQSTISGNDLDNFWEVKKGKGEILLDPQSPLNQIIEIGTYKMDVHPDTIEFTPGESVGKLDGDAVDGDEVGGAAGEVVLGAAVVGAKVVGESVGMLDGDLVDGDEVGDADGEVVVGAAWF